MKRTKSTLDFLLEPVRKFMGRKRRSRKRQSSNALRQNGMEAFRQEDYDKAIETWERVGRQTPDMLPTSALAEAYFRRGLRRVYQAEDNEKGLDDLQRASDLQPDEPRYTYHIGLAAHHQGDFDKAIESYQSVREEDDELAERAAYPLAVAQIQQGDAPAETAVWSALSDAERAMLNDVKTFNRRPYTLSDDAPLLWQGIAALDAGDGEEAVNLFDRLQEKPPTSIERQMAHYYQGVMAGQQERWEDAVRAWNAARAAGLRMERLEENLQEGYHRLAEERLDEDDVKGALLAGKEALRHGSSYPSLEALISQAHQRLAHQAVSKNQWEKAREHWKAADEAEGGGFRLAYNLALAHERSENFFAAGERWREALRRRPRKDDHIDAITDDQVARLWQRAAEAYTKAGEYDEAVRVYKNAVKWNPDRIEARLALSEALLYNGQTQAAENELNRILDRDPDNIPALLRMGEVVYAEGSWWWRGPERYWERVLELDPENVTARQLLVDYYQDQAENAIYWRNYSRAHEMYQQALEHWPDNPEVLAALGGFYLRMDEYEDAEPYINQAMENAGENLMVYDKIIHAWFDVDDPDEAWRVMEEAEASGTNIPYQFYISQAAYGIEYIDEVLEPWLNRAVETAPPGEPVLTAIGEMAVMYEAFDLARTYLERALEAGQEPGQAHLMLGVIAIQEGNRAKAKRHWNEAMRIAQRTNNEALMERIEAARFILNTPPELLALINQLGPEALESGAFGDMDFPDFLDEFGAW